MDEDEPPEDIKSRPEYLRMGAGAMLIAIPGAASLTAASMGTWWLWIPGVLCVAAGAHMVVFWGWRLHIWAVTHGQVRRRKRGKQHRRS
ncbi:MAG: hypothetical protein ACXV5Q_07020 [Frankiaceae bacterium]